jgi:hypothetical protein
MNGDNMLLQCLIQIQHSWYFPRVKNKCWIVVFMQCQSIEIPHGDNNHLHFLGLGKFGPLTSHHFIGN